MEVIFFIFGLVGIAVCAYSLHLYRRKRAWLTVSQTADGKVVRVVHRNLHRGVDAFHGRSYFPVVSFQPRSKDAPSEFESKYSPPITPEVGKIVKVRYDPSEPSDAEIDSFAAIWLAPALLGVVGGIFLIASIIAEAVLIFV